MSLRWFLCLLALSTSACRATADPRTLDPITGVELSADQLADALAGYDVVFLGELHDSPSGHAQQYELTRLLADRRGSVIVSLEMFERDVQGALDRYLGHEIDEPAFLRQVRPWKGYGRFYRPVIEWSRRTGRPVIAANVPRPLAKSVAEGGLGAVAGSQHLPREVLAPPGEYRERFIEAVGGHGALDEAAQERWFQAQCLKDEAMAESIAETLELYAPAQPLIVQWCGRFHSDFGLGTVERLKRRRPDVRCAVVSMVRGAELTRDDRWRGDYVWLVAD